MNENVHQADKSSSCKFNIDVSTDCNIGTVAEMNLLPPLTSSDDIPPKPKPYLFKEKTKHVPRADMFAEDDLIDCVFETGSRYVGEWRNHDMDGMCAYVFPNGVVFEGKLYAGMFDELCTLQYPHGGCFQGFWFEGKLERWKYVFKDGLVYSSNKTWEYLKQPDRRFWTEIRCGLKPGGAEQLTNKDLARPVPQGLYDAGYGFYNPKDLTVSHSDTNEFLRVPSSREIEWIVKNCRQGGCINVGFQKGLYRNWFGDEDMEDDISISDFAGVKWAQPKLEPQDIRFKKLFNRNVLDAKHGFKYRADIFPEEEEVKRDVQTMAKERVTTVKKESDLEVVSQRWNQVVGGEILMSDFEYREDDKLLTPDHTQSCLDLELSSCHVTCSEDLLLLNTLSEQKSARSSYESKIQRCQNL